MRLWVNYTNYKGKKAWREIQNVMSPTLEEYPPLKVETTMGRKQLPCIKVWMVDRQNFRTLALTSISGFAYQDAKPE